jgi:hypothetical protein
MKFGVQIEQRIYQAYLKADKTKTKNDKRVSTLLHAVDARLDQGRWDLFISKDIIANRMLRELLCSQHYDVSCNTHWYKAKFYALIKFNMFYSSKFVLMWFIVN